MDYSVGYNRKKCLFVVYKGSRRVKSFLTEPEAWRYIRLLAAKGATS